METYIPLATYITPPQRTYIPLGSALRKNSMASRRARQISSLLVLLLVAIGLQLASIGSLRPGALTEGAQ